MNHEPTKDQSLLHFWYAFRLKLCIRKAVRCFSIDHLAFFFDVVHHFRVLYTSWVCLKNTHIVSLSFTDLWFVCNILLCFSLIQTISTACLVVAHLVFLMVLVLQLSVLQFTVMFCTYWWNWLERFVLLEIS